MKKLGGLAALLLEEEYRIVTWSPCCMSVEFARLALLSSHPASHCSLWPHRGQTLNELLMHTHILSPSLPTASGNIQAQRAASCQTRLNWLIPTLCHDFGIVLCMQNNQSLESQRAIKLVYVVDRFLGNPNIHLHILRCHICIPSPDLIKQGWCLYPSQLLNNSLRCLLDQISSSRKLDGTVNSQCSEAQTSAVKGK